MTGTSRLRSGRRRRASVLAVAAWTLTLAPAAGSAGEEPTTGIDIVHVQREDDGTVSVLVGVDAAPGDARPGLARPTVRIDGRRVPATTQTVDGGEVRRTTVLALDASLSMRGERIRAARSAALGFVRQAPADVRVGLLSFAGEVRTVVPPTADHDAVAAALARPTLSRGTRAHDAVLRAVRLLGDEGSRSVLLLSDGRDRGSSADLATAVARAADAGVVVDVVALDPAGPAEPGLARLAADTGGTVVPAGTAELRTVLAREAAALDRQLLLRFERPPWAGREAELQVALRLPGGTATDEAFVTLGAPVAGQPAVGLLRSGFEVGRSGLLLGAVAVGLALATVLATALLPAGRQSPVQQHLAAYLSQGRPAASPQRWSLRGSAVGIADRFIGSERRDRLLRRLQGAGLPITPPEWATLHAGTALLGGLVALVLVGPALALPVLLGGVVGPWWYLRWRHDKRLAAFGAQLPETLTLIAGGLQVGLSPGQAIDTVVKEGHEPMASELRRALVEQRIGVDLDEALGAVAQRMGSEDFAWVVMAIRIQREVGGNLAEVLTTVADTLREREYLRRQVRSLSAEGRLSAIILGGLPPLMFCYMVVTNRDYVAFFWTGTVGMAMLLAAVVMLGVGLWFMARIVKVPA